MDFYSKKIFLHVHLYLLSILLTETSSYILRLPCKTNAEFRAKMRDTTIANLTAIVTLEAHDFTMCQYECVFHKKCKSFVIDRIDTCRIFDKSFEDKRDGVSLHREQGSIYYSTFYNETKVGPVCKEKSPCATGQRCFDTCECPGWRCEDIDLCESMPCKNNAACKSSSGRYTCECTTGFQGINCEEIDIWEDRCVKKDHRTSYVQMKTKTQCYEACRGAFYRPAVSYQAFMSRCICSEYHEVMNFNGFKCAQTSAGFTMWRYNCAMKGFYTASLETLTDAECLDHCTTASKAFAFHHTGSSKCACGDVSEIVSADGFQCAIYPAVGITWNESCTFPGGTVSPKAFTKWYCYYHCIDASLQAASWTESMKQCKCHTEKRMVQNNGSSCIELP